MKKKKLYLFTLILFCTVSLLSTAQVTVPTPLNNDTAKKEISLPRYFKTYSHEFSLDTIPEASKLLINNMHGSITYSGWDMDSIVLEAKVWTEAPFRAAAVEVYNEITVASVLNSDEFRFRTQIRDNFSPIYNFGIDYHIIGPRELIMEIYNRFGSATITNYSGRGTFNIDHGDLKINSYPNMDIEELIINLSNGNIISDRIKKGDISHKNGVIEIDYTDSLLLNCDFSKVSIKNSINVDATLKTSNIEIGSNENLNIKGSNSFIKTEEIKNYGFIDVSDGEITIKNLDLQFQKLTLSTTNTKIDLTVDQNLNYNIHGIAEFANFYHYDIENLRIIKEGGRTSFSGVVGNSDSPSTIILFGSKKDITIKQK
ncbi:hypothetical protein QA597_09220 [Marinilabiliaceae bacterium ANBcel2]|nr:hypothetical protein [Marinilabiliaceae bacterium ANBcel2]